MFWNLDKIDREKLAAVDEDNSVTFDQVLTDIEQISSIVNERCVVMMLCENSVGAFIGYSAFTYAGCMVIVLEASVRKSFCQHMIEKYRPQYIWTHSSLMKEFEFENILQLYGYCLLRTDYNSYKLNTEGGVILSTSGSTGDIKCVQLGYAQMEEHAKALSTEIGFEKDDSAITTMPMAFVYTLSFINFHIMKGATLILTNRSVMEKQFWDLFDAYRPTCISGLNLHYEMLNLMKFFDKDCDHMKIFTQGGDVFSPEMREKVQQYCGKYGKKCFILYGQTETGGTCASLPLEEDRGKNCIGKPIGSGTFELADPDESGKGELIYHGKCAMLGYVTGAYDLEFVSDNNKKILTGDIVTRDGNGYYYICGRKKRIVKLNGRRINLDDIETFVKKLLDTEECACIGGKEKVWIVLTKKYDKLQENWTKAKAKEFLGLPRLEVDFIYMNSLIRNDTGKILYAKIEEMIGKPGVLS